MVPQFEPGDHVRLGRIGPTMVVDVCEDVSDGCTPVVWFNSNGQLENGEIETVLLRLDPERG